jgi:hypothetical protein
MDWIDLAQEQGNDPLGFIKFWEVLSFMKLGN